MSTIRPETDRLILKEVPATALASLDTREARLAFWINAYNALVMEGIIALGIRRSVWDLPDFFDRISARARELLFSANEIEHGVLRGNRPSPLSTARPFQAGDPREAYVIVPPDPRIHFAISCGARSCPAVRAYQPERLDEQLDRAARDFVNREVTLEGNTLAISPIFRWFRSDFADFPGGLAAFLARHLEDGAVRRAVLVGGLSRVAWRSYDWSLQPPIRSGDEPGH